MENNIIDKKKNSNAFYTVLANRFIQSTKNIFKFRIFKNEGQEMLFIVTGTFICYLTLLILEIKELMQ
jgi:hypothetical protein